MGMNHSEISLEGTTALKRILDSSVSFYDAVEQGEGIEGPAAVAVMTGIRDDARFVREELERAAEHGEPEAGRTMRWILKRLEAASDVSVYAWHGGDQGHDTEDWALLVAKAVGELAQELETWKPYNSQ